MSEVREKLCISCIREFKQVGEYCEDCYVAMEEYNNRDLSQDYCYIHQLSKSELTKSKRNIGITLHEPKFDSLTDMKRNHNQYAVGISNKI